MTTLKKQTVGIVNEHAWINDTFLAPYSGYKVILNYYSTGKKDLLENDGTILLENIEGDFFARNGWEYRIENLITPLYSFTIKG